MSRDEISAGSVTPEPDWVDVMTYSDFIDSIGDPGRRDLVEAYAKQHGIDLKHPFDRPKKK